MAVPPAPRLDIHDIAARLWETADELRANSHLKAAEYSVPVLGLIFLKFADSRFTQMEAGMAGKSTGRAAQRACEAVCECRLQGLCVLGRFTNTSAIRLCSSWVVT